MNTKTIKEISKWMMIIGGGIFTCGAGLNVTCRYIERKEYNAVHERELLKIKEESKAKELELKREAIAAATAKDELYSDKLKHMNDKEFARFHADSVARANKEVEERANKIVKEAEAMMTRTKLECNEKIDSIRQDCLDKIEKANQQRDAAVEKYEQIDNLFTNKKEIMKAKEALDAAVKNDQKSKEDKEELLKSIKSMID